MIDTFEISVNKVAESRLSMVDFDGIKFGRDYSDHMFMADFYDGKCHDIRIVPFAPFTLSPSNVSLHYGQSVFEGMKAYKNADGEVLLFRPTENFHRINISAKRMCLAEIPEEIFMGGLLELIALDKDWVPDREGTSLYIRPLLFAMDEYIGIKPSDTFRFMIITCLAGAYYSRPVKVMIETHYTRAAEGGTGFVKAAGNYGGSLYPAKLAQEKGYDQLIWTDAKSHEYVEESGTMNVLFIIDDVLVTAPAGDTILKGVTRDSILTLARDHNLKVEERKLSVTELIEAAKSGRLQEAFGVGTAATIASISNIGFQETDYQLPDEMPWAQRFITWLNEIKTGKVEDKYGWTMKV